MVKLSKLRKLRKLRNPGKSTTFHVHVALVRQHKVEAVLSQILFPLFDPPVPVVLLLLHVWREKCENKVRMGGVGS